MIRFGVDAGRELLELADGAGTIAVIADAKNAGKTTAAAAIGAAFTEPFGIVSAGRDGERYDEIDSRRKPRLALPTGTVFATMRSLLPRNPACEIIEIAGERGALGEVVIARSRAKGEYEVAGPASAAGLRRVIDLVRERQRVRVIVDGALDRTSALRSGDAIVIAVASAARDEAGVACAAAAAAGRLRTPAFDPSRDAVQLDGALTNELAAAFVAAGERRQIVVHDATRITARGEALARLDVRARHSLRPVAFVANSAGRDRSLDPSLLLPAIAKAAALPAFDVYACAAAAP